MDQGRHVDPLSARMARWRAALGQSQADLAAKLGISQTLLSDIERGVAKVSKLTLAVRIEQLSASWSEGPIRAAEWVDDAHLASMEACVARGEEP